MNHEPRLPRDDVNVTPRHPIKEAALLFFGLVAVVSILLGVAAALIDRVVVYVPTSWEQHLFPDFGLMQDVPETPEQEADQARLDGLLSRLVSHWPEAPDGLRVGILDAPEPNALAFPGGLILVTSGLMEQVESENELAFVLGHELGHYNGRDHLQSLGRGLALGMVLAAIGQGGTAAELVALSGQFATRSFNREQETQADVFGLTLIEAEFGHVEGATDFFERLPAPGSLLGRSLATYLATHPLTDDRIASMRKLAREQGWATEGPTTPILR